MIRRPCARQLVWGAIFSAYLIGAIAGAVLLVFAGPSAAAYTESDMCIDPTTEQNATPIDPDPVQELFEAMNDAYAYVTVHTPNARRRAKLAGATNQPEFDPNSPLMTRLRKAMERIPA